MKKPFKIGLLVFLWIWISIVYLAVGLRTGTANNNLIPWLFGPLIAIPIWLVLRKKKRAMWIYPVLLTLFFFPTIPVYFTYLHYSNVILRDILLALFFAICIAALLHKGIINKLIPFSLLLVIALFTKGFYGRFHNSHDIKMAEFKFDDYSMALYKFNIRSECDFETYWHGRKYMILGLLYDDVHGEEQSVDDSCKIRLFFEYQHRHFSDKKSEKRIIEYDFCRKQPSFETENLMTSGQKLNFDPNILTIKPSFKTFQDKRCGNGFYPGTYFTYYYDYTTLELDTMIAGTRTHFESQPIYTDSVTLKKMILKTKNMSLYFESQNIKKYYFDLSFLSSGVWMRRNGVAEQMKRPL